MQEERIFTAALHSFEQCGFQRTSMRRIAEMAGVSVGLPNHYFGSKDNLGAAALNLLSSHALCALEQFVRFEDDPIVYDFAITRLNMRYMLETDFREFYLDSLRLDFFFRHLNHQPSRLIAALQDTFGFTADPDTAQLYGRYIPYSVEKTIVLKKEENLFPTISYDEIPWHISYASMGKFVPEAVLRERDAIAREYVRRAESVMERYPSPAFIRSFLETNEIRLDAAQF